MMMKNEHLERLTRALQEAVRYPEEAKRDAYSGELWEAMAYSLLAGGKRIRPMLLLLTGESLGAKEEDLMPFAVALEMVHTYSLVHDDLPAMDDDDYRRGRLTNHKVFGEAKAILAGDGLLSLAFETMSSAMKRAVLEGNTALLQRQALAMQYLAVSCGTDGMVAGQIADINSEGRIISLEELTYIEVQKTSRLLMAALLMGAYLAGAGDELTATLEEAAQKVGLAFQIRDDILDVTGSLETLGKMPKNDEKTGKATFVSLYGLAKAKERAAKLTEEAIEALKVLPGKAGETVRSMVASLLERVD